MFLGMQCCYCPFRILMPGKCDCNASKLSLLPIFFGNEEADTKNCTRFFLLYISFISLKVYELRFLSISRRRSASSMMINLGWTAGCRCLPIMMILYRSCGVEIKISVLFQLELLTRLALILASSKSAYSEVFGGLLYVRHQIPVE